VDSDQYVVKKDLCSQTILMVYLEDNLDCIPYAGKLCNVWYFS